MSVEITCGKLGRTFTLEPTRFHFAGEGAEERVHFCVECPCGVQHEGFGFTPESLALTLLESPR